MPKTNLEREIDAAVEEFTAVIMEAFRSLPLGDLSALRGERLVVQPSSPRKRTHHQRRGKKRQQKTVDGRRGVKKPNYPKCAYPDCGKNRFPRGKGFCGEHWRGWKSGLIKDAEFYRQGGRDDDAVARVELPPPPKPVRSYRSAKHELINNAIIDFVRENPGCDDQLISLKLGIPMQTVKRHLEMLTLDGLGVVFEESGVYRIKV